MSGVILFVAASLLLAFAIGLGMRKANIRGLRSELEQSLEHRRRAFALGRLNEVRHQDKKLAHLHEELERLGMANHPPAPTTRL